MKKVLTYLLLVLATLSFAIPSNPLPADNAMDVNIYGALSWDTDETQLMGNIIYFGTDENAVSNKDESVKVYDSSSIGSFDFSNLDYGTDYFWKIVEDDGFGYGNGPIWTFTTKDMVGPGLPTDPTPADLSENIMINGSISWTNPSGANTDALYFGADKALVQAMDSSTEVYSSPDQGESINSYDYADLEYETTYYWKVLENVGYGSGETEGHVWSFTTVSAYASSDPVPSNLATAIDVTGILSWTQNNQDVDGIKVYLSTNQDLVNSMDASVQIFNGNDVEDCNYYGLNYVTTYYWKVAQIYYGSVSEESPVWSFTTEDIVGPGLPTDPTPADLATAIAVTGTISWTNPDNQDDINSVYFGTDYNLVQSMDQSVNVYANGGPGDRIDSYDYSGLEYETTYYWKVQEGNQDGFTEGPVWSFTTAVPNGPNNPTPALLATGISIDGTISWETNTPDIVSTGLFFSTDSALVLDMDASVFVADAQDFTSYNYTSLATGTTYYWKVVDYEGMGWQEGPVWSFTTEVAYGPSNPTPALLATDINIYGTFSWETNATDLRDNSVYLSTDETLVTDLDDSALLVYGGIFTSYDFSNLDYGTTYYWKVVDLEEGGYTEGPVWSFTTEDMVGPGLATSPTPADLATNITNNGTTSWDNPIGTTTKHVYFGTDYDLVQSMDESVEVYNLSNSYEYSGLEYETTYYWKVKTGGAGGFTEGHVWSFTTAEETSIENNVAYVTTLNQNYPNPFNPTTTIGFYNNQKGQVKLTVYNMKGELVNTLINENISKGFKSVDFDATALNSGVYYYQLETSNDTSTKKMLLIK